MYLRILRGEEGAEPVAKRTIRSSDNSFDTERAVVPAHVTSAHPVAMSTLTSFIGRDTDSASSPRYRMLETVRAYGSERLAKAGERDRVRDAFGAHYLDLAETTDQPETQSRCRELPNMISSQDGTEDRRPRTALRPWRPFCSAAGSACATASSAATGATASPGTTASPGAT